MDFLYLDGNILPASQAVISPFDRGFLYGDGLFETLRIYKGRGHLLRRHLRRLIDGLDYLGIPHPGEEELVEAVHRTIAAAVNTPVDAVLRLTVTRGVGGSVTSIDAPSHPTILITLKPLLQNDWNIRESKSSNAEGKGEDGGSNGKEIDGTGSEKNDGNNENGGNNEDAGNDQNAGNNSKSGDGLTGNGERLITLDVQHVEPAIGKRLKMLNYLPAIYSARALAAAGVREGILLTRDGIVAEGTVSNLFCVVDGVLFTPPLDLGILPGITRERVIELARMDGIEVREGRFDLDFFAGADECFYTNSVRELSSVVQLDERIIGDGRQGEITSRLSSAYRSEIADEML